MGLGLYSEQGIEGIHSEFNIQSEHFDHVKKQDVRLQQIPVNHHVATSPTLAGKASWPKQDLTNRWKLMIGKPIDQLMVIDYG